MALRFSVIVPIYKVEAYLETCVDSILGQSFPDFELILVDDGSPDGCGAICDRYAAKDHRVHVIHKRNGGLVSARKAGAERAVGDYVCCVDGDDWVALDYLAKMAEAVERYSPDMVCCGAVHAGPDRQTDEPVGVTPGFYDRARMEGELFPMLIQTPSAAYFSPSVWAKAIRREIYVPAQLSVPNAVSIAEDRAVTVPCVVRSRTLAVLDECLYYYRVNEQSMTRGGKAFPWEGLAASAEHMREAVDLSLSDFKQQYNRVVAHDFFNAAKSQFNRKAPYRAIRAEILGKLRQPLFAEAVSGCHFTGAKGRLVELCLKKRWILPIWAFRRLGG